MRLLDDMRAALAREESYFRAALMREDVARLERLAGILASAGSLEAFQRDGLLIGWTPGDARTFELKPALNALMAAIWDGRAGGGADAGPAAREAADLRVAAAWSAFDKERMDRLVGCLARVPQPE